MYKHYMNIRTLVSVAIAVVFTAGSLFATGMTSTKYNVFIPPNHDNGNINASLVITALHDNTVVDVVDDDADGDSDDSWNGTLMKGESYLIKISEGAVNDDYKAMFSSAKADGDFFRIRSNKPILALNVTVNTAWQHDFVPADHKMTGKNFYLYATDQRDENPGLVLFGYYGNTDIRIIDITIGGGKVSSGHIAVQADSLGSEQKFVFNAAGEHSGLIQLQAGHTYHIISSKDVSAQFGALQYQGGTYGEDERGRDGAAYVPARNGSKVGKEFNFMIPATHSGTGGDTREMRIISYKSNAHIRVLGTSDKGLSYHLISEFDLNQYDHRDLIGPNLTANATAYHFFKVESDKNIAVFEGAWMETGDYGTSDMATSVSAEDGSSTGKRFTAYLAPPADEPNIGGSGSTQLSHLYFYANDATDIEVFDVNSYGEYVELYNNADTVVNLDGWVLQCFDGSITFRAGDVIPARDYFLLEYHEKATDEPADYVYGTDYPDFRLRNSSDRLVLYNANNQEIDRVWHRKSWAEHGNYYALERLDPTGSSGLELNWQPATSAALRATGVNNLGSFYGTPGSQNTRYTSGGTGIEGVVVNEFMSGRIFKKMSIDYMSYGDFTLDTKEWEALNNGDQPTTSSTDPEAPYITVESSRLLSVMNMNWNDNWYAYTGGLISPTPSVSIAPDYYQRKPGKLVTYTMRAFNTMFYALDSVTTTVDLPSKMQYIPGSYVTSSYLSGVTPSEVKHADNSWTLTWNHGTKKMLSSEVYVFTVTASVDSGLADSTFLQSRVFIDGRYDGDIFAAQDIANVLVGEEKALSSVRFENSDGDSTALYEVGDSIRVRLIDDDENQSAFAVDTIQVTVRVLTGTDSELLSLVETGINTAIFRGIVPTITSGATLNNNGVLTAGGNDILRVTYIDADDPSDIAIAEAAILNSSDIFIRIVYADGEEVGAVSTTTDNDTLVLYAEAYDNLGNTYGFVEVDWSVLQVGSPTVAHGESTIVILASVGSGYIVATSGTNADTTGIFTVGGGRAVDLAISPHTISGRPGDTLVFAAAGVDADGNATGDAGVVYTWSGGTAIGNYLTTTNSMINFVLTTQGTDRLIVVTDYGLTDTTGTIAATAETTASIQIVSGPITGLTTVSALACSVQAFDNLGIPMGFVDAEWSILESGYGRFTATTGRFTVFQPDSVATIRIVAIHQSKYIDTLTIVVGPAPVTSIIITDAAGVEIDTKTLFADDSGFPLYANGYDALGRLVQMEAATWNLITSDTIGVISPSPSESTLFVPGQSGRGYIAAAWGGYSDTTGLITVRGTASIQIVSGPITGLTTVSALACSVQAFDDWGIPMGLVDADWSILEPGYGRFTAATGSVTVFQPDSVATIRIVAINQSKYADTLTIVIGSAPVHSIIITDAAGVEIDTITLSADDSGFPLYANGYDALGRLVQMEVANWNLITLDTIGVINPNVSESTLFVPEQSGTGYITAVWGLYSDTTGLITVVAGVFSELIITIDSTALIAGDSLMVVVQAVDASGNSVPLPADLAWELPNGMSASIVAAGTDTFYMVPTGTGSGQLIVSSPSYGVSDTSSIITVSPGPTQRIEIGPFAGDTLRMYLDEEQIWTVTGYDRLGNSTGFLTVDWATTGNLQGTFTGLGSSASLTYRSDTAGSGTIIVTYGTITDSLVVVVLNERVASVQILWSTMQSVTDTAVTTDEDSLVVYAYAYNAAGTLLGQASVNWSMVGTGGGTFQQAAGYTGIIDFTTVGAVQILANYQGLYDTTGTFTITAGATNAITIRPENPIVYKGDTLQFTVVGLDADGNITGPGTTGALSWNGTDSAGTMTNAGLYIGTGVGRDVITVLSSLGATFTDTATINVVNRPGAFLLHPDHLKLSAGETVQCTLIVLDHTGDPYTGSSVMFADELHFEALVLGANDSLVPTTGATLKLLGTEYTSTASLPGGTALAEGRIIVTVGYSTLGEELFIRCTNDSLQITGSTYPDKGIVWLNPDIISNMYLYPSPVDFNRMNDMKMQYQLRYDSKVTLRIMSVGGSLVLEKVIAAGDRLGLQGINTFAWNGLTRNGKAAGSGAYIVRIIVESPEGVMEKMKKVGIIGKK